LNLDVNVPSSLLLMSRILYLPESMDAEEQIALAMEQMPETVKRAAKVAAVETEGGRVTAAEKLEIITEQQERIDAEFSEKKASEVQEPADHTIQYKDADGFDVTEHSPKQKAAVPDLTAEELSHVTAALDEVAKVNDPVAALNDLKTEHLENVEDMKTLAKEGEGEIKLSRASIILSKQVSKMLKKVEGSVQTVGASAAVRPLVSQPLTPVLRMRACRTTALRRLPHSLVSAPLSLTSISMAA